MQISVDPSSFDGPPGMILEFLSDWKYTIGWDGKVLDPLVIGTPQAGSTNVSTDALLRWGREVKPRGWVKREWGTMRGSGGRAEGEEVRQGQRYREQGRRAGEAWGWSGRGRDEAMRGRSSAMQIRGRGRNMDQGDLGDAGNGGRRNGGQGNGARARAREWVEGELDSDVGRAGVDGTGGAGRGRAGRMKRRGGEDPDTLGEGDMKANGGGGLWRAGRRTERWTRLRAARCLPRPLASFTSGAPGPFASYLLLVCQPFASALSACCADSNANNECGVVVSPASGTLRVAARDIIGNLCFLRASDCRVELGWLGAWIDLERPLSARIRETKHVQTHPTIKILSKIRIDRGRNGQDFWSAQDIAYKQNIINEFALQPLRG
ncbi:hypothetical protein DFH09DRAFT_1076758 [Mycena vulgaris]|nr:hypothetical protein DFH09DRAFT_1076758 [Mycena vulgaris]